MNAQWKLEKAHSKITLQANNQPDKLLRLIDLNFNN